MTETFHFFDFLTVISNIYEIWKQYHSLSLQHDAFKSANVHWIQLTGIKLSPFTVDPIKIHFFPSNVTLLRFSLSYYLFQNWVYIGISNDQLFIRARSQELISPCAVVLARCNCIWRRHILWNIKRPLRISLWNSMWSLFLQFNYCEQIGSWCYRLRWVLKLLSTETNFYARLLIDNKSLISYKIMSLSQRLCTK